MQSLFVKEAPMLTEYLNKAMQHAHFERLEDETIFGSFPDLPDLKGVWADADTEDNCRAELREVLEGWVLLHMSDHTPVPPTA
jgi:predicted RNase H-like HicB family nuclease